MCENSLDAGAKNITIEIKNGGISYIKIIDDGCGISEDDMEIAFERHATSKIRNAEDLLKVKTMGFRGEALASVAAISNIEMISKRQEDNIGHKIIVEGGKVLEKTECAAQNGTSITVRNLFFNTPVRYKFLKKDFTESGYIEDAITRLALINKNVSIKLINNGKNVIQTNGNGDIKTIVYSIYGRDVVDGITEIDYTYEDVRVIGVIGNSSITRSNRNGQLLFVNNRYVKDKTLSSAIDQAYKDIIPVGKYPFAILNLEIDPSKVDCNVHPAKLEVRFEDEQKVFKSVYHAIKSKNEFINNKIKKMPEIDEQEIIFNDELKNEDIKEEKKEFKHRPNAFSGFFKKFLNEKESEEESGIIQDIYDSRKNNEEFLYKLNENNNINGENVENINDKKNNDNIFVINENSNNNELTNEESILDENKDFTVKLGNTIISSDTKESNYNLNDLLNEKLKNETVIFDTTKNNLVNDSKTEVMDSLKKIEEDNNKDTMIINSDVIKNDSNKMFPLKENESIAEKILEQKAINDMEGTQLIDTAKVRSELKENESEENIVTKDFANMYKKVFGMDVSTVRKNKEEVNEKLDISNSIQVIDNVNSQEDFYNDTNENAKIKYRFVGTIFENFAIIEVKDEMYMIEKVAAEERIMYEMVKNDFYNDDIDNSVALLLADIVTLKSKEMIMARDYLKLFRKVGFDYEEFGECTLKLTKVPNWAENYNTKKLFLEILMEMNTVAITATKEKEEKFIWAVSNKAVQISDTKLNESEIEKLIDRLLRLSSPFVYPNGRLTAIKITKANMEKKFSRR